MVNLQDLAPIAVSFVVVGIVLGIGANILEEVQSDFVGNTTEHSAVGNATEGVAELASWLPTIALIIAAAVIIGILFMAFSKLAGQRE